MSKVKPLLIGFVGAMLFWMTWHLYLDHQNWHQVLNSIIQQQQKEKQ